MITNIVTIFIIGVALSLGVYLVYPDAGASKRYGKQFN